MIVNIEQQGEFFLQLQHQKVREEEVLTKIEQKIAERKARHKTLLAQLGQTIAERKTLRKSLLVIAKERMAEAMAQDDSNFADMEEQEEEVDDTTN